MSVAIDSVGTKQTMAGVGSGNYSFSHTASGANRYVRVYCAVAGAATLALSATYDGVAMTSVGSAVNSSFGSSVRGIAQIFELINPPTGAKTVLVNFSTAANVGTLQAVSYTGVHQTTASGTPSTVTGASAASETRTITDSVSGDMIGDCISLDAGGSALTASQTERANTSDSGYLSGVQDAAGAASVGMQWSWTTNESYAHIACAIKQVASNAAMRAMYQLSQQGIS